MHFHIPEDELTKHAQKEFSEGYRHGRFEKAINYVKRFRTAIDIGAHIGSWTVLMAQRFNEVVAIEPSANNTKHLIHNVNSNGFVNVTILHSAASDSNRMVSLIEPKKPISCQVSEEGDARVEAITIDSLNLTKVDFIKIHCNGHEEYALKGAMETIKREKPVLFITVKVNKYVTNDNNEAILKIMDELGYEKVWYSKPDYVFCPKGLAK